MVSCLPVSFSWQQAHPIYRKTYLLLDQLRRVVGILYAQPRKGWQKVHNKAFHALKRVASYFNSRAAKPHRRGAFHSIPHGVSFGGGQEVSVTDIFANLSNGQNRSQGPYVTLSRRGPMIFSTGLWKGVLSNEYVSMQAVSNTL
jgi:hypothetical protein